MHIKKGYKIWLKVARTTVETINVHFDENRMGVEPVLGHKIKNCINFKDEVPCDIYEDSSESKEITIKIDEKSPCESTTWMRKDGSRSDTYYGTEGNQSRLR
ncbi:hypothetical protein TNCV_5127131 [Trichonephila clavipes]|nr:hypothetical protein TNCV_5127131 [Trichonephila clavipes]